MPRVAIIGAGPSGAIALEKLLNAGFDEITVFERQNTVGGTWNLDCHLGKSHPTEDVPGLLRPTEQVDPPAAIPQAARRATRDRPEVKLARDPHLHRYDCSSLYPAVETNVLAELMAFKGNPFKPIYPPKSMERFGCEDAYRTYDVVRDYILDYFRDHEHRITLGVTVERAEQTNGPGSKWQLTLRKRDGKYDKWWAEEFDFLYAATGRFQVPRIPDICGLAEVVRYAPRGTVIHTKSFRDPSRYEGKKILLLGPSWSNSDVAHLSHAAGAQVPIHLSFRRILDTAVPSFAQPWIEAHQNIVSVKLESGNTRIQVNFADGTELRNVDNLILGTGYRISYPYLSEYLSPFGGITDEAGSQSFNLFWTTWWKYDSSLAVTSLISDGITWHVLEAQASATAALWKRPRKEWPNPDESDKWETERLKRAPSNFHQWWPDFEEFFNGIHEAGGASAGKLLPYLELFGRSLELKNNNWRRKAELYLAEHPESKDRYDLTVSKLNAVQFTRLD